MQEETNENKEEKIERIVTMKGRALTLFGNEIKVGEEAPDFKAISNDMLPMKFKRTYKGKIAVILSVPSLDTPVCDIEVRKFNKELENMSPEIEVITISMDLPFAQSRWCGAAGVKRVKTYSDYIKAEFGKNYGVLIKEIRLLARTIFIIDREGIIKYVQLVKEITNEPDYNDAMENLKKLI
jgi:thiol peroxidase